MQTPLRRWVLLCVPSKARERSAPTALLYTRAAVLYCGAAFAAKMTSPITTVAAARRGATPAKANGRTTFWALTIGSVGVVYGDIGTSPLYAFREAVNAATAGGTVTRAAVLGVLSLILWALIVVVTLKYVLILLRADNKGEGGTLTLMALAQRALGSGAGAIVLCGIISAALFYGDAVITPALSVLSAVEGLKVATPAFDPYIVPLTVVILVALFAVQSRGTAKVQLSSGRSPCCGSLRSPFPGSYSSSAIWKSCWLSIRSTRSSSWPRMASLGLLPSAQCSSP